MNDFENTNNDEGTVSFNMDAMDNTNLTALCTDQNVNITSDNTRLTPWRIESYAVFGNKSIFIYHYEMTSTNINQIKYPKSKCFIPSCSPSALSILRVRKRTTKSVLIQNYTVIDLKSVSKTKTGSTKLFGQATSAAKYMSNVILRQTNSYNDTTTESFITGGYVKTEPKLSKILKRTDVESTLSAKVNTLQATDQDNKEDIIGPRSSFAAANAVSVATSGSLSSKPNQISGVTESKVSATHTPLDVIQYPMQDQMNLPTDINEGFKIAVDIVQLDEKTHLQSGTDNPPYVVKSDVFVSMESDLDARNSMAVIISLSAALAAVMLVILVFFLTEVFSRRRYIRNIRIRPSRSFY